MLDCRPPVLEALRPGRGLLSQPFLPVYVKKSDEAVIGWSKERESASLREFFLSSSVVERSAVN